MTSYLTHHFCRYMDGWKDGVITVIQAEDITLEIMGLSEELVARTYCVWNDIDTSEASALLSEWHKLRAEMPPPIPSNVVLGIN